MWPTTDKALVLASLQKIDADAPPVLPVSDAVVGETIAGSSTEDASSGDRNRRHWTESEEQRLQELWDEKPISEPV